MPLCLIIMQCSVLMQCACCYIADIGVVRRRKGQKGDEVKEDNEAKEEDAVEDDDSDFEPVAARKRFRNKLLEEKLAASDSESDINTQKKSRCVYRSIHLSAIYWIQKVWMSLDSYYQCSFIIFGLCTVLGLPCEGLGCFQ